MLLKIIRFFLGYYFVRINGNNIEKVLTELIRRKIYISNIVKKNEEISFICDKKSIKHIISCIDEIKNYESGETRYAPAIRQARQNAGFLQ